jgi:hypothetical protein
MAIGIGRLDAPLAEAWLVDLLQRGGAVTARLTEDDAAQFGGDRQWWEGTVGVGATVLHLAACWTWGEACAAALAAPGGQEASEVVCDCWGPNGDGQMTPRQLFAWLNGEEKATAAFRPTR